MRTISLFAVLAAIAAPSAWACRVAPEPVSVPVWSTAPTPDDVRPGEVALEIEFAWPVKSTGSSDPDTFISSCQPFQDLARIVRVTAGDAPDAGFVVLPGSIPVAAIMVDANGAPAPPTPQRQFVVGRLTAQHEHFALAVNAGAPDVPMTQPGSGLIDRAIPLLEPRKSPS